MRISLIGFLLLLALTVSAQQATIREEKVNMKTYMFSDPDPVPNIGRIYPYFRYDGFTSKATDMEWNMVILENDLIEVWVCPDIGGKVWGAREKSTGGEFLYHNHVVKFRDVAMRGPWTSGGLEFNFGDIGHIPTCSNPVDYLCRENMDGSVSCIVGAFDLPSETRWNIEIKVSPGLAYFETKVSWFNNSEIPHSYYHWMNAAAKSAGNLEFIYPGKNHIGHGGEPGTWPVENDREISWYENNNFGPYKSYHVINSYSETFGGYWHDDDFGFGHYASYDDKPGKKLWIWGLSDQGMIWEDLLTDTDGQYIEFQAGKLFNQAALSSTWSPFKHREFQAGDSDVMREIFFPLKGSGGMVAMSEYAVLNVEYKDDNAVLILSPLQKLNETLSISINGKIITNNITLDPLELYKKELLCSKEDVLKIELGDKLLEYSNRYEDSLVERPVDAADDFNWDSAWGLYTEALELEKQRMYTEAYSLYLKVLDKDPGHLPSIGRIALAHYRRMEYKEACEFARKGLSIDTYNPLSNYVYGLSNNMLGNITEAKSAFSIASHDPSTRTAAYLELSKLFLREKNYIKAKKYAVKSTDYNRNNISASEVLLYMARITEDQDAVKKYSSHILSLDPLSDFARFEKYQAGEIRQEEFASGIYNEFPFESYLDLAIKYYNYGDNITAMKVLQLCRGNSLIDLWSIYLEGAWYNIDVALANSGDMVFPHRVETAMMLEELTAKNSSWLLKYYLGLIYWNKGLDERARELFDQCGDKPDKFWFWLSKAELFDDVNSIKKEGLKRAFDLKPDSWRTVVALSEYYIKDGRADRALGICENILSTYPENPKLILTYARALFESEHLNKCLDFLEDKVILPYEGSVDGKLMYSEVSIKLALKSIQEKKFKRAIAYAEKAKEWPRNLGVGKPYNVDERLEDFLIAFANEKNGKLSNYTFVSSYINPASVIESSLLYLQALAVEKEEGREKALALVEKIVASDPSNIYLLWVSAKFSGDPKYIEIENKILSGDRSIGAYDTKFVDKGFEFLLEILISLNL